MLLALTCQIITFTIFLTFWLYKIALGSLRWEDREFQVILGYIGSPSITLSSSLEFAFLWSLAPLVGDQYLPINVGSNLLLRYLFPIAHLVFRTDHNSHPVLLFLLLKSVLWLENFLKI